MLIHTNQPLIRSFYKKVPNVCLISDELALIRNFPPKGRVRELIDRARESLVSLQNFIKKT